MERIIQPFGANPSGVAADRAVGTPSSSFSPLHHPTARSGVSHAPKTIPDYLRALKRRAWLVALVALVIGLPGAVLVLRQPDVYRATAQIRIDPPTFDHRLATIVPNGHIGQESPARMERYVPDKIAELHSVGLAERVAADPALNLSTATMFVALGELAGLQSRQVQKSNTFDVWVESKDPARAAVLLNTLLDRFEANAKTESRSNLDKASTLADRRMNQLRQDLAEVESAARSIRENNDLFTADDNNFYQQEYLEFRSILLNKKLRHEDLLQQQRLSQLLTSPDARQTLPANHLYQAKIEELQGMKARLQMQLRSYRGTVAKYGSDPAVKEFSRQLQQINRDLEMIYRLPAAQSGADLTATMLSYSNEEIKQLEREVQTLLAKMQDTMPTYRNYQTLVQQKEGKTQQIERYQADLDVFELLKSTANPPVEIRMKAEEPTVPIGPKRKLQLAMVIALGLGLGVGLVCLLESVDHRVKAPEHLTSGLTLPLFGVVPRMRRLAPLHRGGHIWTAGLPNSVEADAYRNVRASLLGATGRGGRPIVTLLITSAKPGEGKSTTALNLAATCARAGERTLLVDVDLRRSSLGEVFEVDHDLGLVDVLQGDLPWQRAVVRTDIPNLDFLPSGDPTGIPVEVLGTIEMQQLLEGLSGHYHRVILDGPAVLGLADCRMLGRAADAALLVVRSGAHAVDPPRRAKAMLEQSQVTIAGVVFNALAEDFENWSSYAPGILPVAASSAPTTRKRGLDAPQVAGTGTGTGTGTSGS